MRATIQVTNLTNAPELGRNQTQRESPELNIWTEGRIKQPRPSNDQTGGKKDAARYN